MDRNLRLSIIVPIYNVERYLEECVNSLFQQDISIDEYEIILINDGSTDKSYEIAKQMAEKYRNITLLTQENSGQSAARNKGLDLAKGKYIMFVDSDDYLFPNVLGHLLTVAEKKDLDVCAYRIQYFDAEGKKHDGSIQPFPTDRVLDGRYAVTHGADIGAVWLNLYSQRMIENHHLRFLEGIYHEDSDFNLRMYAYAERIMYTDIVAYYYRFVPGSSTRMPNKIKTIKLITDDFIVVHHIRMFSAQDKYGKSLEEFYLMHGNSILVSRLLWMICNKTPNRYEKLELLSQLKKLRLYPIKGKTLSWKTTALIPLLNCECLYKCFLR